MVGLESFNSDDFKIGLTVYNDFIVDIKYSEKAVEKYHSAVLYPIQGASHGFNNANLNGMASLVGGEKDELVMPYVYQFLSKHI